MIRNSWGMRIWLRALLVDLYSRRHGGNVKGSGLHDTEYGILARSEVT